MMRMMHMFAFLCILLCVGFSAHVYASRTKSPRDRAHQTMLEMTAAEKYKLMRGYAAPPPTYVGNIRGIPRLKIPDLRYNDGPNGVRCNSSPGSSTAWPSGMTIGGSWDPVSVYNWGWAVGQEFYHKGVHVMLGPGLNVQRIPYCGRNFEYLSGEDPYLGYALAKPVIKGIQSWVVANAKHYINNNQEINRTTVSANVDEQTEFEMYLPPFESAIEAGIGSFMCSYNKINGVWSCENPETLSTYLRDYLNFTDGFVMSDWGATHSVSVAQGLDQELPVGVYFTNANLDQVAEKYINDSVTRILTPFYKIGLFDHPNPFNITLNVTSAYHVQLATEFCENSSVLLQNDRDVRSSSENRNVLPIEVSGGDSVHVAVVGSGAWSPIIHGTGSGAVAASWVKPPLWSICDELGVDRINPEDETHQRCNGGVCVSWFNDTDSPVETDFTHAIVFIGQVSGEGHDRPNLAFQEGDDAMVQKWADLASDEWNVIVVMSAPGAMLTPWSDNVQAILNVWMAGQGMGDCVSNLLFGQTKGGPSGKLHMTFPNKENEQDMTKQQYPGVHDEAEYSERSIFGYRWYNAYAVEPKFPFGFGLSYTTFDYSSPRSLGDAKRSVSMTLSNSGTRDGYEVVQFYLEFPKSCGKHQPVQQLKAFRKVFLPRGASTTVQVSFPDRAVSTWDAKAHAWQICKGTFQVNIGTNSRDILLHSTFEV